MPRGADTVFLPSEEIRFRAIDGEMVILHLERSEVLVVSGVGGRVLELLDGRSLQQVVEVLGAEYEAGDEQLLRDVEAFLADLEAVGVVVAGER